MTNLATTSDVQSVAMSMPAGISPEMGLPERIWTYLPLASQRGATVEELVKLKEVFPLKPGESDMDHRHRISNAVHSLARREIIHKKNEAVGSELVTLFRRKGRKKPAFRAGRQDGVVLTKPAPVKLVPLRRAPPAAHLTPTLSVIPLPQEVTEVKATPAKGSKLVSRGNGKSIKAKSGEVHIKRSELQAWPSHAAEGVRPLALTSSGMKGEIVEAQVQVLIRGNHYSVQEARLVYAELKQLFE